MNYRGVKAILQVFAITKAWSTVSNLALTNCECRDIYPRTVIYKFTISLFTIPAQSEQELYVWMEPACKRPSTCEWVLNLWTGPSADISHSTCERDYNPWQCLKACNTMPFHIPWHASPDHTLYHVMSTRPYHMPCHVHQAISYAFPARPYHYIPCHGRQAIPYIIPCHTIIYHAMSTKPYHILCQAPCLACKFITIYHVMPARPYHIPYDANQAILYHVMPARPYHIPCQAYQAIPYTIICSPG